MDLTHGKTKSVHKIFSEDTIYICKYYYLSEELILMNVTRVSNYIQL